MDANASNNLQKLWTSNAWGDVGGVRYLDLEDQLSDMESLRDHWKSIGYDVSGFTAEDMREFLEHEQRDDLRHFKTGDGVVDHVYQAKDCQEAMQLAIDWWKDGSWENKTEIDIYVQEINPFDDDMRFPMEWETIEVGEDPPEPECTEESHGWETPHEIVGGLKENPGVWSLGGTTMVYHSVCSHCGLQKREFKYGAQRNPGQLDKIEYFRE
jgi:hypothetical protein